MSIIAASIYGTATEVDIFRGAHDVLYVSATWADPYGGEIYASVSADRVLAATGIGEPVAGVVIVDDSVDNAGAILAYDPSVN